MNGKDLLNGFNFVDDSLIEEAETKRMKKPVLRFVVPIAASFAAVLTVFSLWSNNRSDLPIPPGYNMPPVASGGRPKGDAEYTLYFNEVDSQTADRLNIKGHFWEDLTSGQVNKILPVLSEKYQIGGTVNYSHTEEGTSVFSVDARVQADEKNDIKITIAPDKVPRCHRIDGKPVLSQMKGIDIEAGIFQMKPDSKGKRNDLYSAGFKIDDVAYYVEFSGGKNDERFFVNMIADIILGGKADLSVFDNPTVPELRDDRMTEDEAYAETDFGKYLLRVPTDYQFNRATRFINQNSDYLLASWSRGYDDIRIKISKLKEQEKQRIISASDTALYDMSLYPIPWADSMPGDKAYIIENPIFKIEDLTLKSVEMRRYNINEQGRNSVKMRFSVLYDDILMEINTEGVTAEYLFNELSKRVEGE